MEVRDEARRSNSHFMRALEGTEKILSVILHENKNHWKHVEQ